MVRDELRPVRIHCRCGGAELYAGGETSRRIYFCAQPRDTGACGAIRRTPAPARDAQRRPGVTTDENRVHLVGGAFDAGIRLGQFIERDMVAVRRERGTPARARRLVPAVPGFFLCYPGRRQLPAALATLIDALRLG